MSVPSVVSSGYGSWGSVNDIPVAGYVATVAVATANITRTGGGPLVYRNALLKDYLQLRLGQADNDGTLRLRAPRPIVRFEG